MAKLGEHSCVHGSDGTYGVSGDAPHNYACPYCEIERLIALHDDVWKKYNEWRDDAERLQPQLETARAGLEWIASLVPGHDQDPVAIARGALNAVEVLHSGWRLAVGKDGGR